MNISMIVLSLAFIAFVQLLYIVYRTRKERISDREEFVNASLSLYMFDKNGIPDGYIFGRLWRVAHIVARGKALGYELTKYDCYKVINNIKKNFTPDRGVNWFVIDMEIRAYIRERTTATLPASGGGLKLVVVSVLCIVFLSCCSSGAYWFEAKRDPVHGKVSRYRAGWPKGCPTYEGAQPVKSASYKRMKKVY